jgi:HD-GYP domain-containing protein (c-di-GMP phosphodiesterase class II)
MTDTGFVEQALVYLQAQHGICALVLDSQGQVVPLGDGQAEVMAESTFYPFDFSEDIGGLQCSSASRAALEKAEPHIRMCLNGVNDMLQREITLQQTADEMLQLSEQLHFLLSLANKVTGLHDLRRYSRVILEEVARAISADFAFVQTWGKWANKLNVVFNMAAQKASQIKANPSFQAAAKDRTVIFSTDDGTSTLLTPIKEKDGQIGYMAFFKTKEKRFFTAYEKNFVTIIDNIISPTMESLRLYDSLHELYLNTVKALAAAIDAKDQYTHGHSFRVAKYSVAIAKKMDIGPEQLTDLEVAGYMHDLGKIGVPEKILGKPGKLTDEEFAEIKKHPVLTNKILEPIELSRLIVDAAIQHHERLDGRGYPNGLVGDEISLFAKIIAVADVFDALTSSRPYRDAMTVEDALGILCKGIDKEFDRDVVLALVSALREEDDDEELSKLYPRLRFLNMNQMNGFLLQLTELLVPAEEDHTHNSPLPQFSGRPSQLPASRSSRSHSA